MKNGGKIYMDPSNLIILPTFENASHDYFNKFGGSQPVKHHMIAPFQS